MTKNNLNNIKIAIVIQGASNYVPEIKKAWIDFKNDLIFSTWIGSENQYLETDVVIFNNSPSISGPFNFNYQKISTYNGILKAKELGYTHVLKMRSDQLPTNAKEFIKLLKPDKLNFLMWHYTSFLWLTYPTLNGYFNDHLSFGTIDNMLELWNITDNFCFSPEIILTWSYISKLKNKIDINYLLSELNDSNNLFYIKKDNPAFYNLNTNFGDRELFGRYENIFQANSEYTKSPDETKKFMSDNYLNFLKYYNLLPKITIINYNNKDFKEIIYPESKLQIVSDINEITGDYVISSEKIFTNADLIIEYFKKENIIYDGINQNYFKGEIIYKNPGNTITQCNILTKEEFFLNIKK